MERNNIKHRLAGFLGPRTISIIVLCHGILIVVLSLVEQLINRRRVGLNNLSLDITIGVGLTLIYLSTLLGRRKRTALIATAIAYTFYLGANLEGLTDLIKPHRGLTLIITARSIILPLVILLLIFINRKKFVVRSDSQSFRTAIIVSSIILLVTFVYGTLGFYTLGRSGFHQHISVPAAMHYTIDQLNLTVSHPAHPYDRKARLFSDSLTFATAFAILYVLISFVQPLRARFSDQHLARQRFHDLLRAQHNSVSEDFFKLWPHDKQYFFDSSDSSALAFRVHNGTALVLGGPTGKQARFKQLLIEFSYVCWGNDWQPAIIHADGSLNDLYTELGFSSQKIGQEAIVNLDKFVSVTINDKYFRNIINRFNKQGYTFELLSPPHHQAVLSRLKEVSDEWLSRGNHVERGYAMGYYLDQYIADCQVAVARDAAGTIQAFLNLVPADFDIHEATYDLLRSSSKSLGNINDYLLINLCQQLREIGYDRLNLGLCPLVGLDNQDNNGLIGNFLRFAYANGDRFYSFSGLFKFKNKYDPSWKDRYVIYKGGVRGFSRTMNALMRSMRVSRKWKQS